MPILPKILGVLGHGEGDDLAAIGFVGQEHGEAINDRWYTIPSAATDSVAGYCRLYF